VERLIGVLGVVVAVVVGIILAIGIKTVLYALGVLS